MATIYYRNDETIQSLLRKIAEAEEQELEISAEENSLMWQNAENQPVIEAYATRLGKKIQISKQAGTPSEQPVATEEQIEGEITEEDSPVVAQAPSNSSKGWRKWLKYPRVLVPIAIVLLFLFTSVGAAAYYYVPTAEVTLTVTKQTISEQSTIVLRNEQDGIDVETMSIPAEVVQVTKETTKEFPTTGIETVGETATGSIVVYNWTDVAVQLPVGQEYTVNANQEGAGFVYVGTEQVTVPASEEITEGLGEKSTTAGSATVSVEASELGASYNLPGNLFLTIVGYEYGDEGLQGINPAAFAGGTTEEINIVAQSDLDTAQSELQETLEAAAREEMLTNTGNNGTLVEESVGVEIVAVSFDKEVGDEATTFTGTMTVRANGLVYNASDVEELMKEMLQDNIPDGFVLAEDEMVVTATYAGVTGEGHTQLSVRVEVLVVPDLDTAALQQELAGKTPAQAQEVVTNIERVIEGNIQIHPNLPGFLQRLPFQSEKITIVIQEA